MSLKMVLPPFRWSRTLILHYWPTGLELNTDWSRTTVFILMWCGLSEKRPVETKRSFQWKLDRDEVRIFRGLGVGTVKIRGSLQDFNDGSRAVCMYNHVCVRYMIYHSREAVESNTFLLCGPFPRWLSPGFSLLRCMHSSSFGMGGLVKWAQRGSHRT